MKSMKRIVAAAALLASVAVAMPTTASANHLRGSGFGFSGPGFSFSFGNYPRYRNYNRGYDRGYRYNRRYRDYRRGRADNCSYWADRCRDKWGYGRDFRGCMRWAGCN